MAHPVMWILPWVLAVLVPQAAPPEVRIRSGAYTPAPPTISVQANLVELGATVRDNHGKFAGGLQAADFEVWDNREIQKIQSFSELRAGRVTEPHADSASPTTAAPPQEAPQPRSIVLFFDDLHSQNYGLQKSKAGAGELIKSHFQPPDRMAILTASGTVTQDFSSDQKVLLDAVERVRPHPHVGLNGIGDCPVLTPYEAYVIAKHLDLAIKQQKVVEVCNCIRAPNCMTELGPQHVQATGEAVWDYFAQNSSTVLDVLYVAIRFLAAQPEKRILVFISPGFPTPDMQDKTDPIVETALRARIVINSLDSDGLVAGNNPRAIGWRQQLLTEMMSDVSAATGGKLVLNSNDFEGNIRALSSPAEVSYLIGFSPSAEPDGKYHALKVKLKNRSGFQVDSRPGYYAVPPPKAAETVQQRIDREAASNDTLAEVPVTIRTSTTQAESGLVKIAVSIKVDASHLKFKPEDDRNAQQLTFITLLEDGDGHMIIGKQAVMDLMLTPGKLAQMQSDGIKVETSFVAPKGTYQVREIVREAVENHIAASNTTVGAP
jgi:VWFA-related protein